MIHSCLKRLLQKLLFLPEWIEIDGGINGGSWSWANNAGILGDGGAESEIRLLQTTDFLGSLFPLASPSGDFSKLKLKRKFLN